MKLQIIFIVFSVFRSVTSTETDPLGDEMEGQDRPERRSNSNYQSSSYKRKGSSYRSGSNYNNGSPQYEQQPYSEEDDQYEDSSYENSGPTYNIMQDTCPFDCERADSVEFIQSLGVPIFEYYNSEVKDHRYTIEYVGETKDGYKFVKQICRAYRISYKDTVPIWYGYSTTKTDSLLTTSMDEAGATTYTNMGIVFYLYKDPDWYTLPLYRYFCSADKDHLYTISFSEFGQESNGCKLEGVLGWCLPNLPPYMGPIPYGPPPPPGYSSYYGPYSGY